MSAQRLAVGKQIQWRDGTFEIKRLLPGGQVNLENVVTGAIIIASVNDLIRDLYGGQLTFVQEGKHVRPRKDLAAPQVKHLDLADCPEQWVETAKFRLSVIQPLLDLQPRAAGGRGARQASQPIRFCWPKGERRLGVSLDSRL